MSIETFVSNLKKNGVGPGATWHKADFHVHVPACSDYEYRGADAYEQLWRALRDAEHSFAVVLKHQAFRFERTSCYRVSARYTSPLRRQVSAGLSATHSASIRTFGLGLYTGKGLLRGRIVIPIHNEAGELVAYAGRAIHGEEPKYRFPAGFRKSLVLFNLHRALESRSRTVIVVEGFFDTLAVHQSGHPAVVSLMGSTLSRWQADLLWTHFDQVLLMLDGDAAGRMASIAIDDMLRIRLPVTVISIGDRQQPDQLASGEIDRLVKRDDTTRGGAPLRTAVSCQQLKEPTISHE